jgi:DMSO/TMAO reductase YedYZ molybdopterin-dependent catalytic subunit
MPERSSSTRHRKIAAFIPVLVVAMLGQGLPSAPKTSAQSAPVPAELRISGAVSTPLVLTVADLKKMPRKTLSAVNSHDKKNETYEGMAFEELLRRAGATLGEQLRGRAMATYLIAEGEDGYPVVFSLANLILGFWNLK